MNDAPLQSFDNTTRAHEMNAPEGELGVFSLPELLERKRELRATRKRPDGNIGARIREERATRAKRAMEGLPEWKQVLYRVGSFFGYTPEREYHRKLEDAEELGAKLDTGAKNARELIEQYTQRSLELDRTIALDRAEFGLNAQLILHYERDAADLQTRIERAENTTVYGAPLTTELMQLHTKSSRLREDLAALNSENNVLAINLLGQSEQLSNTRSLVERLQRNFLDYEKQRVTFHGHQELAKAQVDLARGLGQNETAKQLYEDAAQTVEELGQMRDHLKLGKLEELPTEYAIDPPGGLEERVAGKELWMTVAPKILGYDPTIRRVA